MEAEVIGAINFFSSPIPLITETEFCLQPLGPANRAYCCLMFLMKGMVGVLEWSKSKEGWRDPDYVMYKYKSTRATNR